MDELEQAIMVSMLYASESTYSHLLRADPAPAGPWQVRRAAEYIEAHWNTAIRIEELAAICNVSVRSLFQMFQKTYGTSPMAFVRKIRLERARAMLRAGGPGVSVTSVCYLYGFSILGRFSRD
ncbi:helix-turn-helix transcriptional regulator [Paracoccus yeei]|uniref:helix-turn-helix transcriptional regulator n=1 Tax=Paracoccus yeei TaxID=147645 RepID=UPI000EA192A9|nr:AraC family transcriptional regulator [Paracoccus yeei]